MATPEITLRGEVRNAVLGCVMRDIESSLDAVQAEYGTALQTFDCLDLLNARAHACSLANAIELLARLLDPDRVDQELQREREFAEMQTDHEGVADEELGVVDDDEIVPVAEDVATTADDEGRVDQQRASHWIAAVDQKTASNWVGGAVKVPDFLAAPRRNDRLNEAGAP
jgi:hypothetical protein